MCVNPVLIPSGQEIACRICWQCRENKVNDWVGRNLAESKTAKAAHSVTLTYGRDKKGDEDHLRAKILTYSDVQKYFKHLRADGYPCRYFAVGEYGSDKGRAHWHVMIYWQGSVPDHELNKRFNEKHWPHGWSFFELPSPASVRYICKYIQKDIGKDERQGHLAMSKKPPLGAEYFMLLAQKYVRQGLAPQDPYYWFPDAQNENGQPIKFYLKGRSLELFLDEYVAEWGRVYPGRHIPNSELVEKRLDELAARQAPVNVGGDPFYSNRRKPDAAFEKPRYSPERNKWAERYGYPIKLDVERQYYYVETVVGYRQVWWQNERGKWTWQRESALPENLQRGEYGRKKSRG